MRRTLSKLCTASLLATTLATLAQTTAPSQPAPTPYEEFDRAIKDTRITFGRATLPDDQADTEFAKLLDTWLKDSPEKCARLTIAACEVLKTSTAPILKDRFASKVLAKPEGIDADTRIELATFVSLLPPTRQQKTQLALDQWHTLEAAIDPKFNPEHLPSLTNSIVFLSSNPQEMAAFKAEKEQADAYMIYYGMQDRYQRAAKKSLPIIQNHLIDAFTKGPDNTAELKTAMESRIADPSLRQTILTKIAQARTTP